MTHTDNSTSHFNQTSLVRRMIVGAVIGLVLVSIYLLGVHANPDWGKYWMIRPILLMTFAGAMGGLCNYIILSYHRQVGINKTIAMIISTLVFIIGLYMGFVLGFDGTLWH